MESGSGEKRLWDIPKRIPSQILDRVLSIMGSLGDMMIQLELEFAERLDVERLRDALDLTLDAEPVLGCRFVTHWRKPYWERLRKGEWKAFSTAGDEGEYEAFRTASIDPRLGPQVKVCLWQSTAGDRLLLKVAHEVSDTGGIKEIAAVLSSIYSQLKDEPGFRPEPNLTGSRGIWQVMRHLPWYAYPRIYINCLREMWSNLVPRVTHSLPVEDGPPSQPVFIRRLLRAERVARLADYGRARQATLNDMMVAAFYRASAREANWDGREQLRLATTVDLRRYLPNRRGEAVCNLSAFEYPHLGRELGDDFASTLARVSGITRRRKANWLGLNAYVGLMPFISHLPYSWVMKLFSKMVQQAIKKRNAANCLTNLGPIPAKSLAFDTRPANAWLLPPPIHPPMFVAGLSGYAGTLTLSAGVYPHSMRKVSADRFFDALLSELPM